MTNIERNDSPSAGLLSKSPRTDARGARSPGPDPLDASTMYRAVGRLGVVLRAAEKGPEQYAAGEHSDGQKRHAHPSRGSGRARAREHEQEQRADSESAAAVQSRGVDTNAAPVPVLAG